jgi:hypothetical protein
MSEDGKAQTSKARSVVRMRSIPALSLRHFPDIHRPGPESRTDEVDHCGAALAELAGDLGGEGRPIAP